MSFIKTKNVEFDTTTHSNILQRLCQRNGTLNFREFVDFSNINVNKVLKVNACFRSLDITLDTSNSVPSFWATSYRVDTDIGPNNNGKMTYVIVSGSLGYRGDPNYDRFSTLYCNWNSPPYPPTSVNISFNIQLIAICE